ncbi:MAG TPA: hypothetical protein PKD13_01510 [Mariniflexile sp.]|nr:hypothetical protein [Mariniflexile sp.]
MADVKTQNSLYLSVTFILKQVQEPGRALRCNLFKKHLCCHVLAAHLPIFGFKPNNCPFYFLKRISTAIPNAPVCKRRFKPKGMVVKKNFKLYRFRAKTGFAAIFN